METKTLAKNLVGEVEYDGRREVRVFDETFKGAVLNALQEEAYEPSDEELEDLVETTRDEFMVMAENRGWRIESICDGLLVIKRRG